MRPASSSYSAAPVACERVADVLMRAPVRWVGARECIHSCRRALHSLGSPLMSANGRLTDPRENGPTVAAQRGPRVDTASRFIEMQHSALLGCGARARRVHRTECRRARRPVTAQARGPEVADGARRHSPAVAFLPETRAGRIGGERGRHKDEGYQDARSITTFLLMRHRRRR
jgi:hypothetical protein